jgi:hypothetical protein
VPSGSAAGAFLTCNANCTVNFSHCFTTTTTSTSSTSSTTTLPSGGLVTVPVQTLKARDGSLATDPTRRLFLWKVRTTDLSGTHRVLAPSPGTLGDRASTGCRS